MSPSAITPASTGCPQAGEHRGRPTSTAGSLDATRTIVETGETGRIDGEAAGTDSPADIVREVATIDVKPGHESPFEDAVRAAIPLFQSATGARTMTLDRSHEQPTQYTLTVGWTAIDDHTVGFRGSPQFQAWRELIGPHIDGLPKVHHARNVVTGF